MVRLITILASSMLMVILPFYLSAQNNLKPEKSYADASFIGESDNETSSASAQNLVNTDEPSIAMLASNFYKAYKAFKHKDMASVASILSQNGLTQQGHSNISLKPAGSVDSLFFHQEAGSKIYFSMVDLGYLKNVNSSMVIKTADPKLFLLEFEKLLIADGLQDKNDFCIPSICAEFQSQGEYWVVDDRWQKKTHTKFESLYYHLMSIYDDSFVINFSETVPQEWVSRTDVYNHKLAMGEEFSLTEEESIFDLK